MSNGDADPLLEDDLSGETEGPSRVRKARAVKKATQKRTAKTAVLRAPASGAARGPAVKSTAAKRTPAKRSTRTTGGHSRVQLGSSEMFVSRDVADALTDKDLKRLRAVFKRVRKRAHRAAAKDAKKKR
jgi:hypothetical protein